MIVWSHKSLGGTRLQQGAHRKEQLGWKILFAVDPGSWAVELGFYTVTWEMFALESRRVLALLNPQPSVWRVEMLCPGK